MRNTMTVFHLVWEDCEYEVVHPDGRRTRGSRLNPDPVYVDDTGAAYRLKASGKRVPYKARAAK